MKNKLEAAVVSEITEKKPSLIKRIEPLNKPDDSFEQVVSAAVLKAQRIEEEKRRGLIPTTELTSEEEALVAGYNQKKIDETASRTEVEALRKELFYNPGEKTPGEMSVEEEDMRDFYSRQSNEHLETNRYQQHFTRAVEALVENKTEGEVEYKEGTGMIEARHGRDPRYLTPTEINEFIGDLVNNDLMASQFTSDMQKFAIDAAMNTTSANGQKVFERLRKKGLFPHMPAEDHTGEMFHLMEKTAAEAQSERELKYKGVSPKLAKKTELIEATPPYKKKNLEGFIAEKSFLNDDEDIDFIYNLLDDAQKHLNDVLKVDKAGRVGIGAMLKSAEKKQFEDEQIAIMERRAVLAGAYKNILIKYREKAFGTAANAKHISPRWRAARQTALRLQGRVYPDNLDNEADLYKGRFEENA
jgi:hypothetical protein